LEPEGLLQSPQEPATGPYRERYESRFTHNFFKVHFNIPSMPTSYQWSLASDFPTKIAYMFLISSMFDICLTHLIVLDLVTAIFGEGFK